MALPVHVQAAEPGTAIKQLSTEPCLFEIGSGSNSVLFYEPDDRSTLSVSSLEVVVVTSPAS
jgi:hypothetical protein